MVATTDTLVELDFDRTADANMRCAYPLDYSLMRRTPRLVVHPKHYHADLRCPLVYCHRSAPDPAQRCIIFPVRASHPSRCNRTRCDRARADVFHLLWRASCRVARSLTALCRKDRAHGATCGWSNTRLDPAGPPATGSRSRFKEPRALLTAALDGQIAEKAFRRDSNFGFDFAVGPGAGVDTVLLNRATRGPTPLHMYCTGGQAGVQMFSVTLPIRCRSLTKSQGSRDRLGACFLNGACSAPLN